MVEGHPSHPERRTSCQPARDATALRIRRPNTPPPRSNTATCMSTTEMPPTEVSLPSAWEDRTHNVASMVGHLKLRSASEGQSNEQPKDRRQSFASHPRAHPNRPTHPHQEDYDAMYAESIADPGAFWAKIAGQFDWKVNSH